MLLLSKLTRPKTCMKPIRYQTSVCYTTSSSKMAEYEYGKPITGKLLNYKNLQIQPQEIAKLFVKQPFEPRQKECGVIDERVASQSEFVSCSESTCVLTFKSEREAQAHMDSGKHVKELVSVSLYDTIRLRWAERVTGISSVAQEASAVFAHEESASSKTKATSTGWALKATQKRPRLGEKVKAFLIDKFEAGERSGTKADPLSVSREMKFKTDDKGELVFQPEEWKTAKTIKSFFSKYSAKLKQQGVRTPKDMRGSQPEVDEEMADDIEALEFETAMQNLRQAVCLAMVSSNVSSSLSSNDVY